MPTQQDLAPRPLLSGHVKTTSFLPGFRSQYLINRSLFLEKVIYLCANFYPTALWGWRNIRQIFSMALLSISRKGIHYIILEIKQFRSNEVIKLSQGHTNTQSDQRFKHNALGLNCTILAQCQRSKLMWESRITNEWPSEMSGWVVSYPPCFIMPW